MRDFQYVRHNEPLQLAAVISADPGEPLSRHAMLPNNVQPNASQPEMLFYDGHCALCHRSVKFVLKHDQTGNLFRFAPLQGPTFEARVPAEKRSGLPDSVIVLTNEGALLVRSNAFLHVLRRLGGGWRSWAAALSVIPRPLRDAAYDFIARVRYRVFGRREDWCPVISPELRARFDP